MLLFSSVFPITGVAAKNTSSSVPQGYTAIYTAEDLDSVRTDVDGKYILMNDIDLSTWGEWVPIGGTSGFSGVFDGNGFCIRNMRIEDETIYEDAGLFSTLSEAMVKNLSVTGEINCDDTPVLNAGAIAGSVYNSSIMRCASYVEISYLNGTPDGTPNTWAQDENLCAGGIAGEVWGNTIIEECYNVAPIEAIAAGTPLNIGGIVGYFSDNAKVMNCYNTADLSAETDFVSVCLGGITGGQFNATSCLISNCYNVGRVSGICGNWKFDRCYVGGIAGDLSGNEGSNTITNCYYLNDTPAAVGAVRVWINEGYDVDILVDAESCNDAAMQQQATYSGFDFTNVWKIDSSVCPYPILQHMRNGNESVPNEDEPEVPADTDTKRLYLIGSTPMNGEKITDLNTQHEISLVFNQNISVNPKWSVDSIYIKDYTTGETILEIDDKEFYSRNGFISENKLTIPLALTAFDAGTYYIEIPAGFFTAQNLNSDGKIIEFDGILNKDELCFTIESDTCRLNELTSVDYLAFSDIAYSKELHADVSVREILSNEWDSQWKSTDIKCSELFEHVANWRVDNIISKENGFAAVAFINDYNEVVIAFRGSENPTAVLSGLGKYASADFGSLDMVEEDAINDWLKNDLPMELLNQVGEQFFDAIEFYDYIANREWIKDVHVTGHSLGGAWGDIVSSYSGCYGETFNAVSALDVVYKNYPEYMAEMFSGVDKQNFVDHVNEFDILAGQFGAALKTRSVHTSNYSKSSIAKNHSLESVVTRDTNGNVALTKSFDKTPDKLSWICANYYEIIKGFVMNDFSLDDIGGSYVDFGTSRRDSFYNILSASNELDVLKEIFSGIFNRVSFGGAGDDEIVSSISSDVIIGGTGDDILSGNLAGDLYLYYKGDGTDYIVDQAGNDYLVLCDFNEDDIIHVKSTQDSQYIEVYCNNDVICYISKECRSAWSAGTFKIRLIKENEIIEQEIGDSYFNPKNYVRRTVVSCPVDVEIIDSNGNVVCVVADQIQNLYYGEFGTAVCCEASKGEYEKIIDLTEGYSTRIVGKSDGAMDVCVYTYVGDELSNPYSVQNIAVTNQMVSTIRNEADNITLLIDENNDGVVDKEIALLSGTQDNSDENNSDTDYPIDNSQENDTDEQKSEKRNWILPVGIVLILLCGVVAFVIAAKKGKKVNPNAR